MKAFEKIYKEVSLIPKGKVSTYKSIAWKCGIRNPKIVGFALHANKDPKNIPCHRVIKSDGKLSEGYAYGGKIKQREILLKEGVSFTEMYRVNLLKNSF